MKKMTNILIKLFLMVMWWSCLWSLWKENCAIDADDYSCHGYYIIKFSSSPYTLQEDLSIDGQVISSGEMLC